jgi:hypothetical protein
MRTAWVVMGVALALGCNNSSSGSGGAAASKTATSADCVTKLMSINAKAGDPEKKLFGAMCDALTAEQRGCIVSASSKDDVDKCAPSGKAFK